MAERMPLMTIYKESFFAKRDSLSWRAKPVCEAINTALGPKSVVDVGCGIGDYVSYFERELGLLAYGIEGSENAIKYFKSTHILIRDLRDRIDIGMIFDVAICFEVAEHIEPEYVPIFLFNLVNLSDRIVMSAAAPGQKGHHHVNCQPRAYWIKKMKNFGFEENEVIVNMIRSLWEPWRRKKEMLSYYNNLFCFERRMRDGK